MDQNIVNGRLQKFSTKDVPSALRMQRWAEFASETFAGVDAQTSGNHDFNAEISRVQIGAIGLTWMSTAAVAFDVEGGHVGRWSAPDGKAFMLSVQETGSCIGHYPAGEFTAHPGDMVLIDPAMKPGWRLISPCPMQSIAIKVPAYLILGMAGDPQAACGIRLGSESPRVDLASSLIISIKRTIEANPNENWNQDYEELLLVTISTLFGRRSENATTGNSQLQRREACVIVEQNLYDPELDAGKIAIALGASIRTVQRSFAELGYTPRSYILHRRIHAAAKLIKRNRNLSITDVAMTVGFNDLSYFARSFRAQTGQSPREYRTGIGRD